MLDITAPKMVEVEVRADGKVLWVNVDGVCVLRICRMTNLTVQPGESYPFTWSGMTNE